MFSKAVHEGRLQVIEESEASIACGLRAAMAGVGFMPSRAWQGTDLLEVRPDVATIEDPYSGQSLTAFPAIRCDVAVIHVLRADRAGNAILGGNPTIDLELALVSDRLILTAETVVDELQANIDLPALDVTSVVHMPRGAWPTSCYPAYPLDGEAILAYIDACNQDRFWDYVASLHDSFGGDDSPRQSQ
jgi:glutaconate CoA-transferase subunit A